MDGFEEVSTLTIPEARIQEVGFSPDSKYLLVGTERKLVRQRTKSGRKPKVFAIDDDKDFAVIEHFAFADRAPVALTAKQHTLEMWDSSSGKLLRTISARPEKFWVVAVSPDGRLAASGGSDNSLRLWNLETGAELRRLGKAWEELPSPLEFSPDGRFFASGHGSVFKLWDPASGRHVATLAGLEKGEWVIMTPEGYYNSSENGDRYINVRVGEEVYGIENYRETFYRPDLVQAALRGDALDGFASLSEVKPAPDVRFVDAPQKVSACEASVTVELEDRGGGVGNLRLFLNGTAVAEYSPRGLKVAGRKGQSLKRREITVGLSQGENTLTAWAFNADGSVRSNEVSIRISADCGEERPALHALVIGIEEYENPKLELKYAADDADLFANALSESAKGLFGDVNVVVLKSRAETSRKSILEHLEQVKSVRPGDLFVFYVAAHGLVDDGEYYLLTSDVGSLSTRKLKSTAVGQSELRTALANVPASKKLIVLDTCSAGAMGNTLQVALTRGMSDEAAIKILSRAVGSTILSAATSMQQAVEGYEGHGLFTYVLVEGLKGKADTNGDGFVKTLELADYVDEKVPELAERIFKHKQFPLVSPCGMGFPVGKTPAAE